MGVDMKSNATDTAQALRTSERATQFTRRLQTNPRPTLSASFILELRVIAS